MQVVKVQHRIGVLAWYLVQDEAQASAVLHLARDKLGELDRAITEIREEIEAMSGTAEAAQQSLFADFGALSLGDDGKVRLSPGLAFIAGLTHAVHANLPGDMSKSALSRAVMCRQLASL